MLRGLVGSGMCIRGRVTKYLAGERIRFLLGLMGAYIAPVANGDRTKSQEGTAAESSLACLGLSTTIALV